MTRTELHINQLSSGAIYIARIRDGKFVSHHQHCGPSLTPFTDFMKAVRHYRVKFQYAIVPGSLRGPSNRSVVLYIER